MAWLVNCLVLISTLFTYFKVFFSWIILRYTYHLENNYLFKQRISISTSKFWKILWMLQQFSIFIHSWYSLTCMQNCTAILFPFLKEMIHSGCQWSCIFFCSKGNDWNLLFYPPNPSLVKSHQRTDEQFWRTDPPNHHDSHPNYISFVFSFALII